MTRLSSGRHRELDAGWQNQDNIRGLDGGGRLSDTHATPVAPE